MWGQIAAIYRVSKKKKDINWWTEWVCRPPAAVFVYFLQGTPITPNQVTILSVLVCAGAGAMFVTLPGQLWAAAAALVFELSFVLDCVDGQLARLRKMASPLGHLFDFLMDEIKAMLIFGCIAVRLWRISADDLYLWAGIAGLFALASGISMTSFMRRPEYGAKGPTADGQPAEITRRPGVIGLVITGIEHLARTVVHYPSHIWLFAAFDRLDLFFWIYGGVNVLYLARTSLVLLLRLGRFR
ncbi:MAG TPA: CDP-alcohol phosphatidyltransferase family protein [Kofleriaceae bacterium]|jgi:phosphatidylglycerophosphate synthase|nr:CDP-alcohol phosphatidyltransferase family protein [Kofleriaceae bacterium]